MRFTLLISALVVLLQRLQASAAPVHVNSPFSYENQRPPSPLVFPIHRESGRHESRTYRRRQYGPGATPHPYGSNPTIRLSRLPRALNKLVTRKILSFIKPSKERESSSLTHSTKVKTARPILQPVSVQMSTTASTLNQQPQPQIQQQIRRIRTTRRIRIVRYRRILRPIFSSISLSKPRVSKTPSIDSQSSETNNDQPSTLSDLGTRAAPNKQQGPSYDENVESNKKSTTDTSPTPSMQPKGKEETNASDRVIKYGSDKAKSRNGSATSTSTTLAHPPISQVVKKPKLEVIDDRSVRKQKAQIKKKVRKTLDEEFPVIVHGMNDWPDYDKQIDHLITGTLPISIKRNEKMIKLSLIGRNLEMTDQLASSLIYCLCEKTNTNARNWGVLDSERITTTLVQVGLFLVIPSSNYTDSLLDEINAFTSSNQLLSCIRLVNEKDIHRYDNKIEILLGKKAIVSTERGVDFIIRRSLVDGKFFNYDDSREGANHVWSESNLLAFLFGVAVIAVFNMNRRGQLDCMLLPRWSQLKKKSIGLLPKRSG